MSTEFSERRVEILERQVKELEQALYYLILKVGGKFEITDALIMQSPPLESSNVEVEYDAQKGITTYKIIERRKQVDKEKIST